MTRVLNLILLITISFTIACSKSEDDGNSVAAKQAFSEKNLTIGLYKCETFTFGDDQLSLCVDSIADSRCPANVNCIWGGTAITKFTFTKNGQDNHIALAIPAFASYQQQITIAGYTIQLIDVYPFPQQGVAPSANERKVKVEIRNY
jgi:hypothetical protein